MNSTKKLKKGGEKVRKIGYAGNGDFEFDDEQMSSLMRNVRHLSSLTKIDLKFHK